MSVQARLLPVLIFAATLRWERFSAALGGQWAAASVRSARDMLRERTA